MMLLMGMWMSFTKNPMNPIIAKPIAVAMAIFWNSEGKMKQPKYLTFTNSADIEVYITGVDM